MNQPPSFAPPTLRFGRFELQPTERRLLADGQPLAIGARAFDMLLLLAQHAGRLVSKDELLDTVWAGLVVEENNLQVQASTLRRLLGADAIATIPGRGYRFALSVRSSDREALPAAAAASATLATARSDALPQRLPTLHGREADVAAVLALCEQGPLVTIAGPGGIGKTRLAQQVAQQCLVRQPQGIAWVELAPLTDAALLPGAVGTALGLQPAAAGDDPLRALLARIGSLQVLIVLDNAEHLLDGVARFAQALLRGTPGVRLLVTSQAPLRLDQEALYRLDALALPPPGATPQQALQHGAVALLVERVRALDRRFVLDAGNLDPVLAICRRLDGLPLALQLAAARVPSLGVQALADGLDARFALLRAGSRAAAPRHTSLQAVLDWGHELLAPEERAVWRRVAVFAGGFTLELACEVGCEDGADSALARWDVAERLATLVERSLVAASDDEPPRYALSETARTYALERLDEAAETACLRRRHAAAVRRFFAASQSDWLALRDADWLARYEPELDNLRAALAQALADDPEAAVALVAAAAPLWHHLALDAEARRWVDATEPLLDDKALPPALAAAWWRGAQWAWADVAPARSRAAAEQAQQLYRELGDAHGLYAQLTGEAGLWSTPDPRARAALDAALQLERPDWPPRERAWGQRARADVARAEGRLADSRAAREAELALRIAAGDERGRQRALAHLAELALALGEAGEAVRRGRELVATLQVQRPSSTLCRALLNLMNALLTQGDVEAAAALAGPGRALAQDFGLLWLAADELAWLAALQGRFEVAARLIGWADAAFQSRDEPRSTTRAQANERAHALASGALGRARFERLLAEGAGLGEAAIAPLVAAGS